MARSGNGLTITTTPSNLLTGECRRLWVKAATATAQPIRVRVRNRDQDSASGSIHGAAEYTELAAGDEQVFDASAENPIVSLELYTGSATGTASWSVTG